MMKRDPLFDAWPGAAAPAGFADRVLARHRATAVDAGARPGAAPSRRRLVGALVAVVAVASAALWWSARPRDREVPGGRAIAVDETCLRVEVDPMRRELAAAGAGAGLAVAMTVLVYEGAVTAHNSRGKATAEPGQSIQVSPGQAPTVVEDQGVAPQRATREQLLVRDRLHLQQIAQLTTRVRELEAKLGEGDKQHAGAGSLEPGQPRDDKFFDFSPEEARWLAARCEVRYDIPGWALSSAPGGAGLDRALDAAGMSEGEKEIVRRIVGAPDAAFLAQLRELYVEVTGNREAAESLSPRNMQHEILDKSRPEEIEEAQRQISAELAGMATPPADLSARPPGERLLRLLATSGGLLERQLAAELGPDRARELRTQGIGLGRRRHDGCPGAE